MPKVTTRYVGDLLCETELGSGRLVADVPAAVGGKGRGPTGLELLLAALGSCVTASAAFYCARAGLDAEGLAVEVQFERADNPIRLTNLRVRVHAPKVAAGPKAEALQRAVANCPVHATLTSLGEVPVEVVAGAAG